MSSNGGDWLSTSWVSKRFAAAMTIHRLGSGNRAVERRRMALPAQATGPIHAALVDIARISSFGLDRRQTPGREDVRLRAQPAGAGPANRSRRV
jgi:hypothetical protein